jgi:hypothetical protein
MLRTATTGDSRTIGNTASTLDAALEPFMRQSVIDALQGDGEDPTDFNEFLDAGGTIYLLGKDSEVNSVAPLTTAIAEDLLDLAEAHAIASPAGRLDPALLASLDEAPNIAPIPSLRQRVADGRGRGITVIYGLQAWASARARFGEDTAKELAAFTNNVVVFSGDKDPSFLKDMSDLCDQVERERKTGTTTGGDRGGHSTATHMALNRSCAGTRVPTTSSSASRRTATRTPMPPPSRTRLLRPPGASAPPACTPSTIRSRGCARWPAPDTSCPLWSARRAPWSSCTCPQAPAGPGPPVLRDRRDHPARR